MFILFLVRFQLLSGHLLGNSSSLRLGFEGWIWVLIASVPDFWILYIHRFIVIATDLLSYSERTFTVIYSFLPDFLISLTSSVCRGTTMSE